MKYFISFFFVITVVFFILSLLINNNAIEIVAVTLITTFYHLCLRPLTGPIINMKYRNNMNFKLWWFQEKKFEKNIYNLLKVKKWKNTIPTYDKMAFDIKNSSIKEIIGATCQAEIVHEIMFVLAFIPLLLIIPYGHSIVFIVSSVLCALIDLVCVVIQRYNRPRLIRIYEKQHRKI